MKQERNTFKVFYSAALLRKLKMGASKIIFVQGITDGDKQVF